MTSLSILLLLILVHPLQLQLKLWGKNSQLQLTISKFLHFQTSASLIKEVKKTKVKLMFSHSVWDSNQTVESKAFPHMDTWVSLINLSQFHPIQFCTKFTQQANQLNLAGKNTWLVRFSSKANFKSLSGEMRICSSDIRDTMRTSNGTQTGKLIHLRNLLVANAHIKRWCPLCGESKMNGFLI